MSTPNNGNLFGGMTRAEYEARKLNPPHRQLHNRPPAAPDFVRTKCDGCQKDIVWAVSTSTSKRSPLDPLAPVFAVRVANGGTVCKPAREWLSERNNRLMALRDRLIAEGKMTAAEWAEAVPDDVGVSLFTTHFATCPNAKLFSGRNAKKGPNQ